MNARLSLKQIGKRIQVLRKSKGFSQEDLAKYLEIPRSSVAQIELGNRNVSISELMELSDVLGFSLDKFLASGYEIEPALDIVEEGTPVTRAERISVPDFKPQKVKNVLLYILEQCAGKPNVGETVLYKLLYFSDFNYYEQYEEHLTGSQYRKLPFGPVPEKLDRIIGLMKENGQLKQIKTEYHGYPQTRFIPLEKSDLTKMNAAEKEVIDQVIDRYSDWSASAFSDYSHMDMPWKASEEGEIIDYELVFYRETPYTARTYGDEAGMP